ncbi:MAG: hypothetical protein ACM31C_24770 [Acidobacteriota bacterium]
MRNPSVFAIVLVATAGVAAAQPKQEENNERVRYGDLDKPKSDAARDAGGWRQLATPTPVKHGTEFIEVGKDQGNFDKLRVDADKGRVVLRRVKIYFEDGKQQDVELDKVLDRKHKSAEIDLKAQKPIDRVVITTEPHGSGEYALYGSSGPGVATR